MNPEISDIRATAVLVLVFFWCCPVRAEKEPRYLAPLATGGAPDCPEHVGFRNHKSELAKTKETTAYLTGVAARDASGCQRSAELHIEREHATRSYPLPDGNFQDFSIADFSPDGSKLLLVAEGNEESPNEDFRDVQIAVVPLSSGEMHWTNIWDIFQWQNCVATVNSPGFANDDTLVLPVRPSVMFGHHRANCVLDEALYSVNLAGGPVKRLPSNVEFRRNGSSTGSPCQTCKNDPDLVSACFTVHGRISMYNGTPTLRIWKIGTDRKLGVQDFIVPESIATNLTWEKAGYGDFYVCPFTREKPDEMQIVCVESASKVIYKKW